MPPEKKAISPALTAAEIEKITAKAMALAQAKQTPPTPSEKREIEKAERAQARAAVLHSLAPAIKLMREKRASWKEIGTAFSELTGLKLSVRELREAVGEMPAKKSPPAPQTPSPAEPTQARSAGGRAATPAA